jgi:hypothetical protein
MQAKHGRGFLQVYSCKFCHGWHLGNALSVPEAMKMLAKLESRMTATFYLRAPQKIQTRFHDQRMALTAYLISRM